MARWLLLPLLLLLTVSAPATSEPPPITLHLTPLVGYRPLNVQARLVIEPDYLNREACLVWIERSGMLDGRACWQVEGQYARRVHYYLIKQLPTGDYRVVAYIVQVRGAKASTAITVRVLDSIF